MALYSSLDSRRSVRGFHDDLPVPLENLPALALDLGNVAFRSMAMTPLSIDSMMAFM